MVTRLSGGPGQRLVAGIEGGVGDGEHLVLRGLGGSGLAVAQALAPAPGGPYSVGPTLDCVVKGQVDKK